MISLPQIMYKFKRQQSLVAFQEPACAKLYELLAATAPGSIVVEIGVQFGRSSTIFGLMSKELGFEYYAYDNFSEDISKQAMPFVISHMRELEIDWALTIGDSKRCGKRFCGDISLILIDGDHTYEGVKGDIEAWTDKVIPGGYVLFHDYGHDSLEGVTQAVDETMMTPAWEYLGKFDTLAVFRKKTSRSLIQFTNSKDLGAWYDSKYKEMDGGWVMPEEECRRILDWMGIEENKKEKLLDVGCGAGHFVEIAGERVDAYGIDLSPWIIEKAYERRADWNGHLTVADIENSGLLPGSFHYITSLGSIEHTIDIREALAECQRILKPLGLFYLLVPNELWTHMDQPQEQTHTDEEWQKMFEKAGFMTVKMDRVNDLTNFLLTK